MVAASGKGRITIVIPKTGFTNPIVMQATTLLNLYADAARCARLHEHPVFLDHENDVINAIQTLAGRTCG